MTDVRILVVFHSDEGHTTEVAARIAARLHDGGAGTDLRSAEDAPDPDGYDGVVLGDSVHHERHSKDLLHYAGEHRRGLESRPSALFQVSLTSATHDPAHDLLAHEMVQKVAEKTNWEPDLVGLFAGALAYTRYGWFRRRATRHLAEHGGLDTDTTTDHDYTDWDAVDAFADHFLAYVREHAGASPQPPTPPAPAAPPAGEPPVEE